jgi:nicotinate-nucleotide--dimethylbenzimidazole phosphoribosyltransferase
MPRRALGELLSIAEKMAGITGKCGSDLSRKVIVVMAGDHGVAEEGVSAYPQEVTGQMVRGFVSGMAAINHLSRHGGIDVRVADLGCKADFKEQAGKIIDLKVRKGTSNFTKGPAMSLDEARSCVEKGMALAARLKKEGYHIIGTGDMGIGNTTPSTAIAAAVTGRKVPDITGRGTGIDDRTLAQKIRAIEKGLLVNKPDKKDGLQVLAAVGGFEIGGLAGLLLGCAAARTPAVVDGVISTAAALVAFLLDKNVRDYLFVAHKSEEKAQAAMLEFMGLKPMMDFSMRLGEGTGCALAMPIIEAAVKVHGGMATFEEAGVSRGNA